MFFRQTSRRLYPDLYGEIETVLYERALVLREHLAKREDRRTVFACNVLTSFIDRMELDAIK